MLPRLVLLLALAIWPAAGFAKPWVLSPATVVRVDVPWHGSLVPVHFPKVTGTVDFDEQTAESAHATITVDARSATTGVGVVDALVRSADYLGSESYPEIVFNLDSLTRTSKSTADVAGRITLRGQTHSVKLTATVFQFGPAADDSSRFEAGFDVTGKIDRTEFGSTGGLPDVGPVLNVNIHLLMTSK